MQPKRQQNTGRGDPPPDLTASIGEYYRDETSGRRWIMTPAGWRLPTSLQIDVLGDDKQRWIKAARREGLSLEHWVIKTLNLAATKK